MLDPTHIRWKRLAVSGWERSPRDYVVTRSRPYQETTDACADASLPVQLGQHAVLPLPHAGYFGQGARSLP
jgi:hypothetical protein